MSVILVNGIPNRWNLMDTVINLAKTIRGQFEALNFGKARGNIKEVYLRLSERLDPTLVVERICKAKSSGGVKLRATIPDHIPDIPLAAKPKRIPYKICKMLKIEFESELENYLNMSLTFAHKEILLEMQYRFPGLYNLSSTTGHKLLDEIARTVFERLRQIIETNTNAGESCFTLSKCYRKTHPHFGDFQLVLGTLHALQDAAGVAREHVSEEQLAEPANPQAGNLPFDLTKRICKKYCDKIIKKVRDHIGGLNSEITPGDPEEEIARKRVRGELKKVALHLPQMLEQLTQPHFGKDKPHGYRMRIYGEPFLPPKEQMMAFVKRYILGRSVRSGRMYNMLGVTVLPEQYSAFVAMDGTVYNGAKLLIRSSFIPKYNLPESLVKEINEAFSATAAPAPGKPDMHVDGDAWGGHAGDWAEEF